MKKILSFAIAATGVAVAGASFAASAPVMQQQQSATSAPWYVGAGLNYNANFNDNSDAGTSTARNGNDFDLEDSDVGGQVFVGYDLNQYLGTEGGFTYLGEQTYGKTRHNNKQELEDQWNLHWVANAYLPVNDWFTPYAFGGVSYLNGELKHVSSNNDPEADYSGFGLIYGAGLKFSYDQFGVRVNYTKQTKSSSEVQNGGNGIQAPHDYISLDVLYHFSG